MGGDFFTSTNCFTVAANAIYLPVDSNDVSKICRLDLSMGNRSDLFSQTGRSMITSIRTDSQGNIYIVGSCAFDGIDFNGYKVTLPPLFQYPQYIVRYRPNGTHHWSKFMEDATCFVREFSFADDNTIYYTGPLTDSLTLGNLHLHQAPVFGNYMVAQMDSNGNFNWAKQASDTASGEAMLSNNRHATVGANGSLVIFTTTRHFNDWGDNITTTTLPYSHFSATAVAYSKNGATLWAKDVKGIYVSAQQVAIGGDNIWLTGNTYDSTAIALDAMQVPVPSGSFAYYPFIARLQSNTVMTGVAAPNSGPDGYLMPNPAKGYFTIGFRDRHDNCTIRVHDNTGRTVMQQRVREGSAIDVHHLARGMYFVEINSGAGTSVQKLILQ